MLPAARAIRLTAVTGVGILFAVGPVSAKDFALDEPASGTAFVGSLSCTSVSCHGNPPAQHGPGSVWQQVYARWHGSEPKYHDGRKGYDPRARMERHLGDPHALARQRMTEPRFQEVLRRYSTQPDGSRDNAAMLKCAGCHDPMANESPSALQSVEHGIGCESCHGPAQNWLARHYALDASRDAMITLGMVDTKDLLTRARVCASCHVGSSENDMNHDMIAAGHPPLRFEMASYEALLPAKHWDDSVRRVRQPDYEVELWAAGRLASTEASLMLLQSRAKRAASTVASLPAAAWPEFAESNCFACHQSLEPKSDSSLSPALVARRAILPWRTWNHALLDQALSLGAANIGNSPQRLLSLGDLRATMENSLVPDADETHRLAGEASHELHLRLLNGQSAQSHGSTWSLLLSLEHSQSATWDELCQHLAALVAARRALQDHGAVSPDDLQPISVREKRIAAALRQKPAEWTQDDLRAMDQQLQMLTTDLLSASRTSLPAPRSTERVK